MHVIVTAGPTIEPLDQVRRLTNFSTGRLGCELANFLAQQGHQITLLISQQATWSGPIETKDRHSFATTNTLKHLLSERAGTSPGAICHAAAVSDFKFGQIYQRKSDQTLVPVHASGKIPSRQSNFLVELQPTEKIIASLKTWFPNRYLVGWKFEVEGNQDQAVNLGAQQIAECHSQACVVNGPAYGPGFGWVTRPARHQHLNSKEHLFQTIHQSLEQWKTP